MNSIPRQYPPTSILAPFILNRVNANDLIVPPPLISSSEFVPKKLIELLMRKKKDSAIGVKFRKASAGAGGDIITTLEGAMHTFVTPVVGKV